MPTFPSVYVAAGDITSGKSDQKTADFTTALADPNVTGPVLGYAWDGGALFQRMLALSGDMPFIVSMRPWPVPTDGSVPTFQLDGRTVAAYWESAYGAAWQSTFASGVCDAISAPGVADRCAGMRVCFVTPYGDNEDGLFASDPAGGGERYDALFAAQGFTPDRAIAATTAAFNWLASQAAIVGLTLSLALLTPGNQTRVNDAGQVIKGGTDQAVPNAIVAAYTAAFPNNQKAMAYDVYTGAALPDWWQGAVDQTGNLVIQMHGTDQVSFTKETFITAFVAAVALAPAWIEVHTDQIVNGWLAAAVAALAA